MLIKFKISCLILFFTLLFNCQEKKINPQNIALKVGNVEFTDYELFHYYTPFETNYKQRFRQTPPSDSIKKFKDWFIKRAYWIADAYKKKYDTLIDVKERAERMFSYEVTKKDGILWNAQEKNKLLINKIEEEEALEKMRKLFYFNVSTINLLPEEFKTTFKSDTLVRSTQEYNRNLNKYKNTDFFKSETGSFQWPFFPFEQYRDKLLNAKEGEIIGPMYTNNGISYLHITLVEELSIESLTAYKKTIGSVVKLIKESDIIYAKEIEIGDQIDIKINLPLFQTFLQKINAPILTNEVKWDRDTLMKYKINDKYKFISTYDFATYLGNYPEPCDIKNRTVVKNRLQFMAHEDFLMLEAKRKDILNTPESDIEKTAIFHSMMFSKYYENEFVNSKVSENEIQNLYESNRDQFVDGEKALISRFDFNNQEDAIAQARKINEKIVNNKKSEVFDFNDLKGLISLKRSIPISLVDSTAYKISLVQNIFAVPDMTLLGPFQLTSNQFSIILKESENGKRILSFKEVKDFLVKQLRTRKISELIEIQNKSLLNMYTLDDRIDL